MKKLLIVMSACLMGAFFATSCCKCNKECNKPCDKMECPDGPRGPQCGGPEGMKPGCPNEQPQEEMCPKQKEMMDKWMKFDSLSTDEQKAFLKERKAEIDQREAEMAAKKAEMDQKWADFDNLSIEEQKQLIEMKSHCPKAGKCGKGHRPEGKGGHHGEKPEGPAPEGK